MTIAAGFLCKDGVVLCADTLISGGIVSSHKSKIGGYRFRDGVAIFAFAGHVDMAEAAIQQCEETLCTYSGKPRSRRDIAKEIRRVLAFEYKTHIIDNQYQGTVYDYSIIAAIQSDVDGLSLYCTAQTQMKSSRQGFELIGEGESIGLLAVRRFGDPRALRMSPYNRTALIAAYAIGEAKRHQEGSVGGGSVIIQLEKDGRVRSEFGVNEPLVEKYATKFHHYSDTLMAMFLTPAKEEQFRATLNAYPRAIQELRDEYRKEVESDFYLGTAETTDTVWELNTPDYLMRRLTKKAARSDPESTTSDPSGQPPPPESPGGSGES